MDEKVQERQKCPECGLELAEGVVGLCPRCGASRNEDLLHPPVLSPEEEYNPYEEEYRLICANAGGGQDDEISPGEFIVSMERKADDGDAMAQHFLATSIYCGKDDRHAFELLRQSAAQGNVLAELDLGICYATGHGVAQDRYAAIRHYRKAAAKGCVESIATLASYYSCGEQFGLIQDEAKSAALMRIAAERGSARAQMEMFDRFWSGRGVERDLGEALMWCRLAADRGYAPAETEMALCYDDGIGVRKDPVTAFKWFERAASHGDLRSMLDLSLRCCNGIGTEKNLGRAYFLALSAADAGLEEACVMVAHCFRNGIGVAQDVEKADKWLFRALDCKSDYPWRFGDAETVKAEFPSRMRWAGEDADRVMRVHWWAMRFSYWEGVLAALEKAVALGDHEAEACLGNVYENGMFGVERDDRKALQYYQMAADFGNPRGEERLANAYGLGHCGVERNISKAESFARRSAEKGCPEGEYTLACILISTSEPSTPRRSEGVEWLRKSSGQDYALAHAVLGRCLLLGEDVERNVDQGLMLLDRAASQGEAYGMLILGRCFYGEFGVARDYVRAWDYFSRAAERGNADAFFYLAEMQETGLGCSADAAKAMELLKRGAELGSALAYLRLGGIEYAERCYSGAFKWYSMADKAGLPEGKYAVAFMYWRGDGVAQNERKAIAIAKEAVKAGAKDVEGILLHEGEKIGAEQDKPTAMPGSSADNGGAAEEDSFSLFKMVIIIIVSCLLLLLFSRGL